MGARSVTERFSYMTGFLSAVPSKKLKNPNFTCEVLFTDEASFLQDVIRIFHNNHFCGYENPHIIVESGFQQKLLERIFFLIDSMVRHIDNLHKKHVEVC